ncbi:myotilin isoform X2 [Pleurodeles waltl]|uniref:myotilin isoform X2 n=1 Tax=Pleurodeles waltl TaxID=8319 RepID=UPI003709BEDB
MSQMKRKTTSVSLTIGSSLKETSSNAVRQSSSTLIQPISIDPKRLQGPSAAHSSGGAPVFTKCLQDISTSKGQLVVFECRIRATSPFQVNWYREHHPIIDSADFRILRKKACLSAVPEEVCTLVITEAYPEDSGVFKCVAENNDGVVTSSAHLFVFPESYDIEIFEALQSVPGLEDDMEKMCLQNKTDKAVNEMQQPTQPENLKIHPGLNNDDVETIEGFEAVSDSSTEQEMSSNWDTQLAIRDCTPLSTSSKTAGQRKFQDFSPEAQSTISPKLSHNNTTQNRQGVPCASRIDSSTISSVPPPSMFNYERPKHFIQAQPTHPAQWSSQGTGTSNFEVKSPSNQTHNFGEQKHSPSSTSVNSPKYLSSTSFVPTMEPTHQTTSSAAQFPPSFSHGPKMTLTHSQSPAAYLSSMLPSHTDHMNNYKASTAVESSYLEPAYKNVPKQPPPTSDHQIQGTKDALIQDLERKLRCKDSLLQNGNQRLTYEERMARRLLGRENAASVFEINADDMQDSECPDNQASPGQTTQDWNRPSRGEGNENRSIQEKLFPPRFLTIPGDLELEEGRFCRIDFKVTGLPAPDVAWFLNGRPVRADEFHKMIVSEKGFHSLILEMVRLADAGEYECVATNRAGKATFRMQLDVLAHEHRRAPSFIRKPQSARGMEGDTVRIECQVAAVPFPQILLKKNNEMLQYNTDRIRLLQDSNGKICLLIYNVSKKDDGWYTISAVNEAGVTTCHARVDVGTRFNPNTPAPKPLKVRPTFSLYSALNEKVLEAKQGEAFHHTEPSYPGLFESDEL